LEQWRYDQDLMMMKKMRKMKKKMKMMKRKICILTWRKLTEF
jgi:hypothetical protein